MAHNIPAIRAALNLLRTGTAVADAIVIISDAFEIDGAESMEIALYCIERSKVEG